jgi:hypothetical protein
MASHDGAATRSVVIEEVAVSPGCCGLREREHPLELDAVDRLAEEPRPAGSFPSGSPDPRRLRDGG